MIAAMENFIPNRRAVSSDKKSVPETPSEGPQIACPSVQFCSRPGSEFLHKKDTPQPLCPPPLSCKSQKRPKNIEF